MADVNVVVLSGGLDSGTCLGLAAWEVARDPDTDDPLGLYAISFNYGQRHSVELECAADLCRFYKAEHKVVDLSSDIFVGGVLTDYSKDVPDMRYDDLPDGTMSPTYVPFRNGNLLAAATAYADSLIRDYPQYTAKVWAGQHAEDAAGFAYADCTPEFLGAMASAIYVGTYGKVRLWTPFAHLEKHEIIQRGLDIRFPYELTHSCYRGERPACGQCSTCHARIEAFQKAGTTDPLEYKES